MMVRHRLQTQSPALKRFYLFSANCTRCPAKDPPRSWLTSSTAGSPLFMNTTTKSMKEKWNPVNKSSKQCIVGKIFGICNKGAEIELAGDPRTLAIGCNRQWVSWDSDHEAQQRYNRLQKQSWIAYYLGKGREWWVGKLYLLEDAGKVAGVPRFGTDSSVCSFPVQHSETVLTPPPGERPRHQLGRLDKCDWSLTIYPHTWHGIRGYKVIPEVAAYTQSH